MRCGFCTNLRLPERIVTTHLVRDCKKLANTKCLQCGELGHTAGRCPLNHESKPKYPRKSFVVRDQEHIKPTDGFRVRPKSFVPPEQARKPAPTKPTVDADGFQVQPKKGSAYKTTKFNQSAIVAPPKSVGEEVTFETKKPEPPIAPPKPEPPIAPPKPEQTNARGAWAAGAPKNKPVEVRPHQEIRPKAPEPAQYMSTQSASGNYAIESAPVYTQNHKAICWADDDEVIDDWENDPFFK